jgi:RNA polymerase sigma-70 factor (ECF subfamily)
MEWEYNETELIKKAKDGNNESLSHLIHHHYNYIYNYLLKMTMDQNLAADLTQDTCYKIVKKIDLYNQNKSAFSTWIIQIAINTYKDYYRRNKRKFKFFNSFKNTEDNNDTEIEVSSDSFEFVSDSMLDLKNVLSKIEPLYKEVILLKYYYGYEQKEIANILDIPVGTVKSRLSNGLKLIREGL